MPLVPVPLAKLASPRHSTVPAGTVLWRVTKEPVPENGVAPPDGPTSLPLFWPGGHLLGRIRPTRAGRFDPCAEHDYSYCYVALDDLTALAETLLRDTAFLGGLRPVLAEDIERRRLILLETHRELRLISLVSVEDLAAAWQDTWLVQADETQYGLTRCWGHWLRECSDGADGMVWRSKRNPEGLNVVLFGERCADAVTPSALGYRCLDDPAGLEWLNRRLSLVRTYVVPPGVDEHQEVGIA